MQVNDILKIAEFFFEHWIEWILFLIILVLSYTFYKSAWLFIKVLWEKDAIIVKFIEKLESQNQLIERMIDITKIINENIIRIIDKK